MSHAIDISTVKSVTQILKKELFTSPAALTNDELSKIGVKIITGVTNVESEFISLSYSGAVRAYDMTKEYTEKDSKEVSMIIERPMKTWLAFRPATLNLQAFKEKEPFPTTDKVDLASLTRLPQTVFMIMDAGERYGEEIINGFFHAKRSLGNNHPLGFTDGAFVHIAKDMTTYTDEAGNVIPILISKANKNLIETDPITEPTTENDWAAWTAYEHFVDGLSPSLKRNKAGVLILVDDKRAPWIYRAYMNRYKNLQASVTDDGGYQFFTHKNVKLIPTPLMGDTNTMIATRPENFHFGIESERNENNVRLNAVGFDPNKLHLWIQSYQGTRLLNPTKSHFAINCNSEGKLFDAIPYEFGDIKIPVPSEGGETGE